VTAMLEKQRDNIGKALPALRNSRPSRRSGVQRFYYQAYIPNLNPSQLLQPLLRLCVRLRRGVKAGQPPDNAGPRAELPFPYNGIPQPGDCTGSTTTPGG